MTTAVHPQTQPNPAFPPKGAHAAFGMLALAGFLATTLFVFVFGAFGERLTAGIDLVCAEAAFDSAKKLETRGNHERALQRYRQALDGRFRTKEREYLCLRSYGEALYRLGRYSEAIEIFRRLDPEAFDSPGSLTAFVSALARTGAYDDAAKWGNVWLDHARQAQDQQQTIWASDALGSVYMQTGQFDQALTRYRESEGIAPQGQAGVQVAQVLYRMGKKQEALAQLDNYLSRVSAGQFYEDAKRLRREYDTEAKSGE